MDQFRTVKEFRDVAQKKLPEPFLTYYSLSSGDGRTFRDSEEAFKRYTDFFFYHEKNVYETSYHYVG